jgi:hypothetical protein
VADAWVRVDCERCGSVSLPASDVRLMMAGPESDDARDTVAFHCGTCGVDGAVLVDERAARLVARAGAALTSASADPVIDRAPGRGPRPPG